VRGIGRGSAAITIVNALLCGRGAAAAIELHCQAIVELARTPPGEIPRRSLDPECDTPLARASLEAGLTAAAPGEPLNAHLTVRSEVPWARGLKSSSAASVAILDAVGRAWGTVLDPMALARRSAEVAQTIGLSATGAFDDALAAAAGGLVITDNHARELLGTLEIDPDWRVALWVPPSAHPPSPELGRRFSGQRAAGEQATLLALGGEVFRAMEVNSRAVEELMAYPYAPLRRNLLASGALGVGVSGMGPAVAAVAPASAIERVARALPSERGTVLRTRFRAEGEYGPVVGRGVAP
jgi:shikimate kinase